MKAILNQDVSRLGKRGDVVQVNDGYARNYLFPRVGQKATAGRLKEVERQRKIQAAKEARAKEEARALAEASQGAK